MLVSHPCRLTSFVATRKYNIKVVQQPNKKEHAGRLHFSLHVASATPGPAASITTHHPHRSPMTTPRISSLKLPPFQQQPPPSNKKARQAARPSILSPACTTYDQEKKRKRDVLG
jgi:hypothetical protein